MDWEMGGIRDSVNFVVFKLLENLLFFDMVFCGHGW